MPIELSKLKDVDGKTIHPRTFEEAVEFLWSALDQSEKDYLRDSGPYGLHFTLGRMLRNEWNLWEETTPLSRDTMKKFNCAAGDDVSGNILKALAIRAGWPTVKVEGAGAGTVNGVDLQVHGSNTTGCSNHPPRAITWENLKERFRWRS